MSKEERKSGGAGKVFLGIFLGILLTLGSIFGVGCLVYFKGSVRWLNKFGANIDTGSDKLNNMTISQIVGTGVRVLSNSNTMTLNDLATEYGYTLSDTIGGIDITDIKESPLSNLANVIKEKYEKLTDIENLTIKDIFGNTEKLDNSVLSLIPDYQNAKISNIVDELQEAVKTATMDELYEKGLIDVENYEVVRSRIGNMTLTEIVAAYIATLPPETNQPTE